MPRTAELAIQILFDVWEERKRSVCPWMGGGHDLYWDAATLWKTSVTPSIFYKAQECLYYKAYLCCSHLQDMILRCSLQVFVAFHHYLSLGKKLLGRQLHLHFHIHSHIHWSTSLLWLPPVSKRGYDTFFFFRNLEPPQCFGFGIIFCRSLTWSGSMLSLICQGLVEAINRYRGSL